MEKAVKAISLGLVSLSLLALPALAQQPTSAPRPPAAPAASAGQAAPATPDFVSAAMTSNQFEIDTSNLALKQGSDKKVKSFAQQMVKDHTNAGKKMMGALKSAKIEPPGEPTMDTQQQQMMSQLKSAQGAEFDRQYLTAQLTAHQNAVALFQAYSSGGDNPVLKKFAGQTLPTLKKHLSMVEKMNR